MSATRQLHLAHAPLEERARSFLAAGALAPSELLVVDTIAPRFGEERIDTLLALAFAVRAPRAGHVGVVVRELRRTVDDETAGAPTQPAEASGVGASPDPAEGEAPERGGPPLAWPHDLEEWEALTLASRLVGAPGDTDRPFVRQRRHDGSVLLMTRRMWREQERLAEALLRRASAAPSPEYAAADVERVIERAGAELSGAPAEAVRAALRRSLTLVTGGPGTGKTHSVKHLLARALELRAEGSRPLRIELAAPTGKAAVRMRQAIRAELGKLRVTAGTAEALGSLEPQTLHKLIGVRPDGSPRHDATRPLAADLVVVDEASMIDLVLMRQLVEALPEGARLVLLGDRAQLASVEVGSVLSDLVEAANRGGASAPDAGARASAATAPPATASAAPFTELVVRFTEARRYAEGSGVARLARLLQEGTAPADAEAVALLTAGTADVHPLQLSHPPDSTGRGAPTAAQLTALAAPYVEPGGYAEALAALLRAGGPRAEALRSPETHGELLLALERYRVLAVHRLGARGVSGLEAQLARRVHTHLRAAAAERGGGAALPTRAGRFLGEPVLVTENSYELGLMNGDIGLVLPGTSGLAAIFPTYGATSGPTREIALARLPPHQGALALTVHKSQGSQFGHVALVLAGRDSPIQTRELVYTAITRAERRLTWLGERGELERALARPIQRVSGLAELLTPS